MLTIDGSQGEGGGQILRTSLALAMVTGQAFRIERVRAGRQKPGLLRQHLTAANAAAAICSAEVDGAAIGSNQLTFKPGKVVGGTHKFGVGSAGSTMLVLQTILPALMIADGPSTITFEGGTHNPFAPPLDFVGRAFLPLIKRMGPSAEIAFERAGFYPAGGGRFSVSVTPVAQSQLRPFQLDERGETKRCVATAIVAGLSGDIAKRELAKVRESIGWTDGELKIRQLPADWGPGNLLMLEIESEHITEVFTSFGMRGVTAEAVAEDAVRQARSYLVANAPVGPCLADQLMLPLAMAGAGSFVTSTLTRHSTTNVEVIARFLGKSLLVEELNEGRVRVSV